MKIVQFQSRHLAMIDLQEAQAHFVGALSDQDYAAMLSGTTAFTALNDAGQVIACAGFSVRWENCAQAWALLAAGAGRDMVGLVRALRGYLEHVAPWRRVEAAVDVGFQPGERLLMMLGFEYEGLARAYRPDGADCTIWARIKL